MLDPLVIVITWVLVLLAKKFADQKIEKLRHLLPLIALGVAIAARAVLESTSGLELSWLTVQHGVGAAGVAVLTHSQGREIFKALLGTVAVAASEDSTDGND